MAKILKRLARGLCVAVLCAAMMGTVAFAAYEPVTATIPVEVKLSGTLPETPDTFQIEMKADDAAYPMPEGAVDGVYTLHMEGAGTTALNIVYDKLGIYSYTVRQLPLGNDDCYQDEGVYHITAYVTNNEDYTGFALTVAVYREGVEEKQSGIVYANRYANPTTAEIVATKTMDKKIPKDGAFTFELVDAEGNVVQSVTNVGENVFFEPIFCDEIGQTIYTLREKDGGKKSIIYDTTEYTVVLDVTKDDVGDYVATVTYLEGEEVLEGLVPAFANVTAPPTGDETDPLLLGGVMVAALAGIVVLLVAAKRKKKA